MLIEIVLALEIIILFFLLYLIINKIYNSYYEVPSVEFPFKNIYDEDGKKLNIIAISAPFREEKHEKLYDKYRKDGLQFCGISSYLEFPNKIVNPYEDRYHEKRNHDYVGMVRTWLHCFKEDKYISKFKHIPHLLITEADLKDHKDYYKPDKSIKKEYDFIYVCLKDNDECSDSWQSYNRNWTLAKKCLKVMCSKFGLKGLLVGRVNCEITDFCDGMMTIVDFLPFHEFQKEMQKCKFIFVPNVSDASPRVITEALCYDIPALVNWNIFGGWHNIKPGISGEFFTNEVDIEDALSKLIHNLNNYKAREWYTNTSGKYIKGVELANFLKKNYPEINNKNVNIATI